MKRGRDEGWRGGGVKRGQDEGWKGGGMKGREGG